MKFKFKGLWVLALALATVLSMQVRADGLEMEQIDSTPETTCTLSYFGNISPGRWREPTQLQQIKLDHGELSRSAEIDTGFGTVNVRLSRERDSNNNWRTTVALSAGGGGIRVYDYGQAAGSNCPRPGASSVAGTASFSLTDDRAQARSQTQCVRAESTASGSEDQMAFRVACTQPHSPGRDRERELERQATAGSGGSQSSGSSAGKAK